MSNNLGAKPAVLRAVLTIKRKATGKVEHYNVVGYDNGDIGFVRDKQRWVDPDTGLEVAQPTETKKD